MTIQISDFTDDEQTEIARWTNAETGVIPPLIVSLMARLDSITETKSQLDQVENIYEQIYDSYASIMLDGFLLEVRALNGDWFTNVITESVVNAAIANPSSTVLFPGIAIDPALVFDLATIFDATTSEFSAGSPPSATASGFNEYNALANENIEWNEVSPDGDILLDFWQAEQAALLNQQTALQTLDSLLDAGETGKTNVATALGLVASELATVGALISSHPSLPSKASRQSAIASRQAAIVARLDQIRNSSTGDYLEYRNTRYFWLRKRLNLSYGSAIRYQSIDTMFDNVTQQIADLETELQFFSDHDE